MSQLPASSLEQLFSFEANIESGFAALLNAEGLPQAHSSRSTDVFKSPFIALWFQNGEVVANNQHPIAGLDGAFFAFNSYTGVLTTECVTQRSDPKQPAHTLLIAQLRVNLQMFRIRNLWGKYQAISLITDIREAGTLDTWEDESGLDHTTISWNVLHSLNKNAWPAIVA